MRTIQKMIVNVNVEMWIQHEGHFERQKIKLKKKKGAITEIFEQGEEIAVVLLYSHTGHTCVLN